MHVAIIGNGITGVTAAVRVRALHPDWRISIISGESQYHYSRPALMYVYLGHMRYRDVKPYEDSFWKEQRLDLIRDWVVGIDTDRRQLQMHHGASLAYDRLLIATGSKSNRFGWKGQDLEGVQGLYDLMDLRLLYRNTEQCRDRGWWTDRNRAGRDASFAGNLSHLSRAGGKLLGQRPSKGRIRDDQSDHR